MTEAVVSPESAPPASGPRSHYGPWASLALTAATMGVSGAVQTGVLAIAVEYVSSNNPGVRKELLVERLIWDGAVFSSFVILSSIFGILAVMLWVRFGKGLRFAPYLALDRFGKPVDWGLGAICLILLGMGMSLLPFVFDEPDVPEYMIRVYESASNSPLTLAALIFGVVVAGPVFEEIVFRGFLFRGVSGPSAWRTIAAIFSGALIWSVIHLQYGSYEILQIFLLGLALGYARWRTGSLWVPIGMHSLVNALAMMGVAQ